ncbi:MAG: NADH-quinone oxidoreductase subunit L [Deltaproteobacteria bacterium]|nr:NADH-quinone oxidoreductase subunit L [Deltaproteobacteria bacterium]
MSQLLPWCFLFPLPFLVLNIFGIPRKPGALSFVGPLAVFVGALVWLLGDRQTVTVLHKDWIPFLPDSSFSLSVDGLAAVMLAVVGGVATCVFIYAIAYMKDDERAHRFFAFLDFFVAAMCLLVVAGNLTVLLAGWTAVGIASFLLISFWWERGGPLQAGLLALGANAIGDAALLVAAVAMPVGLAPLSGLSETAPQATGGAVLIAICIVIAACAKSAQGPLWFWLPAAMAGPTPVSALIHAATMVAAGVYLLVRVSPLLAIAPEVMTGVVVVGLSTALLGGIASLWQTNFKRGIAYSTASQLGWMFVAVGVGAPFAAFFHLVTHAAFKAMLFLSAGTIIHAAHHEEDIRKMGGLRKHLKGAHAFFLIGSLCLIGTPFLSGSFSKDAILEAAHHHGSHGTPWVFYALLVGVLITGAYAGRLYFGLFHGVEGSASKHAHEHAGHLGGFDYPLIPLAIGAVLLGYFEAVTHGLSTVLGTSVLRAAEAGGGVHFIPTPLGIGAFALGLVGFVVVGRWLAQRPEKGLPVPGGLVAGTLVAEMKVLPSGVAAIHNGHVGRYLLITMLGVAVVAGLALRPPSGPLPKRLGDVSSSSKKSEGKADKKGKDKKRGERKELQKLPGFVRPVNKAPAPAPTDVKPRIQPVEGAQP